MTHGLIQHGRELAPSTHEKAEAKDASIPLVLRTGEERPGRLFQVRMDACSPYCCLTEMTDVRPLSDSIVCR